METEHPAESSEKTSYFKYVRKYWFVFYYGGL